MYSSFCCLVDGQLDTQPNKRTHYKVSELITCPLYIILSVLDHAERKYSEGKLAESDAVYDSLDYASAFLQVTHEADRDPGEHFRR